MVDFQNIYPEIFLIMSTLSLLMIGVFFKNSFVLRINIPSVIYTISLLKKNHKIYGD